MNTTDLFPQPILPVYRGYIRATSTQPWSLVCEVEGLWNCWRMLASFRHPTSAVCEKIVLPVGCGAEIVMPTKRRRA